MKRMSCLTAILISLLSATAAHAGPSTGSGNGDVMVCRNADGTIKSATLLDLVEATERYKLSLPQASGSMDQDFRRAVFNMYRLRGLNPDEADSEAGYDLMLFRQAVQYTLVDLPALGDIGETVPMPSGCNPEPVAVFHDETGQLFINTSIWLRLDSLSQAALVSHELLYRSQRSLSENTSEGTRLLVAHIYSDSNIPAANADLPARRLLCETSGDGLDQTSRFYAYPSADGANTILQLTMIMGRPVITKATLSIAASFWNHFSQMCSGRQGAGSECGSLIAREPVSGPYAPSWEVEAVAKEGQPVVLRLYEKGISVGEAPVSSCRPEN